MHALRKYFAGWAEPESAIAESVEGAYDQVLVVPAYREDPAFLDGYDAALRAAPGRTLCIVVANAKDSVSPEEGAECERLQGALLARVSAVRLGARAYLGSRSGADVLVLDRTRDGERLPAKQGVGLARKIGADVALAVHARGHVRSPWIHFGDADATLPPSFFEPSPAFSGEDTAVVLRSFWHVPGDEPVVTGATALYELSLRYFVEGLAFAGSVYAFHTLGSTLSVRAHSYAAVRGVPRKEAAEDFYLLNKLSKVGAVVRHGGDPVLLRARRSDRVPFGTGASVTPYAAGDVAFYAPACFHALGGVLGCLDAFVQHADVSRFQSELIALGPTGQVTLDALSQRDVQSALGAASRESKTVEARRLRVHSWFDAFRTLKVVHALRDRLFPNLPWREAFARASFAPFVPDVDDPELTLLRREMWTAEHARSALLGPAASPPW